MRKSPTGWPFGVGSFFSTYRFFPTCSLAAATTASAVKPNFFWSSFKGAEAAKGRGKGLHGDIQDLIFHFG